MLVGAPAPVSIRRADYWLVEAGERGQLCGEVVVSIRRADYWLVEGRKHPYLGLKCRMFQSAGRIIGWLKGSVVASLTSSVIVSIRRADYWLVEVGRSWRGLCGVPVSIRRADYWLVEEGQARLVTPLVRVSIRRADYWLVEAARTTRARRGFACFNPPGGLLVG